jgi:hypothetical protein
MSKRAEKLIKWHRSEGGIYFPEEMDVIRHLYLKDKVKKADGVLGIYKIPVDENGVQQRDKAECLACGTNLIVDVGRASLRALQAHTAEGGTAAGTFDLGTLAVGGGTNPTDGSNNGTITPQPGDTAILDELTSVSGPVPRPTLALSTPPPGPPFTTNLWSAQIGTTELNGNVINNAGLYCLDNQTLFSFRTFVNQVKDSGFVMEFRWSIIF